MNRFYIQKDNRRKKSRTTPEGAAGAEEIPYEPPQDKVSQMGNSARLILSLMFKETNTLLSSFETCNKWAVTSWNPPGQER
jgi:hypothetical protein